MFRRIGLAALLTGWAGLGCGAKPSPTDGGAGPAGLAGGGAETSGASGAGGRVGEAGLGGMGGAFGGGSSNAGGSPGEGSGGTIAGAAGSAGPGVTGGASDADADVATDGPPTGECRAGVSCAVEGYPCRTGTTQCDTGVPVCAESATAMNGTVCGANLVCNSGTCVPCTAGVTCMSSNLCRAGAISCRTGVPICADIGILPNGTPCGTNMLCASGACSICRPAAACKPSNPCHTGTTSCLTAAPVCEDTGTPVADGTTCGTNMVSTSGRCSPVD